MKHFLKEFQKTRDVYNELPSPKSGLICVTGVFEGCPFIRLHRSSWISGAAGIFFSVWTDNESARTARLHYNIHALKLRQLKSYVITSRTFASAFRKDFKALRKAWPNVDVNYGPLNLMQGWIELREKTLAADVLRLMNQFDEICPILDRLLEERIAPVRRGR